MFAQQNNTPAPGSEQYFATNLLYTMYTIKFVAIYLGSIDAPWLHLREAIGRFIVECIVAYYDIFISVGN